MNAPPQAAPNLVVGANADDREAAFDRHSCTVDDRVLWLRLLVSTVTRWPRAAQ